MTVRRITAFLGFALAAGMQIGSAQQRQPQRDPFDDWAAEQIGEFIGDSIAGIIQSAADYAKAAQEVTREIQLAREKFWKEYPSSPGLAAARKHFAEQLYGKDIFYLSMHLLGGPDAPPSQGNGYVGADRRGYPCSVNRSFSALGGCRSNPAFRLWPPARSAHGLAG
jgi:hypothetical protein